MTATESPPDTATTANRWYRLATISASTMVLWAIALQFAIGAFIPPVTIVGALFGLLAFGVSRLSRTWVHAAVALLPLLALGGNLPPIMYDLSHPEEGVVFGLTVLSIVAALTTSLAGFSLWASRADRGAGPVGAVAAGIVLVAAAVGTVASTAVESVQADVGDVTVEARSLEFGPDQIVIPADATGVWVDNIDPVAHTFSVDGTDIDLQVPGSSSQRIDVDLAPGTYDVFCAVPGHEAMTATLTVEG